MANIRRTVPTAAAGRFSGSRISRTMTFSALVSALAIAAFATESRAANWTGCHGGVAAGFSTITTEEPFPSGADGTQLGIAAGCDYQFDDRLVFGALVGYEWKTFDVGVPGEIDATALTIGGRAGLLLGRDRDTLAYGLLAYTNTEFDVDDGDDNSDGLAYGGGLETVVYRNRGGFLTLKGEARRIDHDDDHDNDLATETTVTAGLAYHFGGGAPIALDVPFK
jgi:Outer membrane protein beta-barrel domain